MNGRSCERKASCAGHSDLGLIGTRIIQVFSADYHIVGLDVKPVQTSAPGGERISPSSEWAFGW